MKSCLLVAAIALFSRPGLVLAQDSSSLGMACSIAITPSLDPTAHAVACAEDFVRTNGYTDAPASSDSARLAYESIEWGSTTAEILSHRHNSLRPNADIVCFNAASDTQRYLIVFLRSTDSTKARAVTMDSAYYHMRMQHRDVRLDYVSSHSPSCFPALGKHG